MDPFLKSLLGSFFRWLFTGAAAWLVSRGVIDAGGSAELLTGAVAAAMTLTWAIWTRYKSRIKFLTALESPVGTSEADVKAKVAAGLGATLGG